MNPRNKNTDCLARSVHLGVSKEAAEQVLKRAAALTGYRWQQCSWWGGSPDGRTPQEP